MTWTDPTTLDVPGTEHRAVELGRVYRDNDDVLVWMDQTHQAAQFNLTGLNNMYPNTTASGVKIKFFKPAHAKKLTTYFYVGNQSASTRRWGFVRFNGNPALDSALFDSNVSAPPWQILSHDLSSLAEGYYDAEVYVGHDGAAGNLIIVRLPSGSNVGDPGVVTTFDVTIRRSLHWDTVDWSLSPASDLTDATLTADKGHTEVVGQMWYDRDEKHRRRPAAVTFAEKNGVGTGPGTWNLAWDDVCHLYVPKWADTLCILAEVKVTGGTGGIAFDPIRLRDGWIPGAGFWDVNVTEVPPFTNTSYDFQLVRVHVAPLRGEYISLRLRLDVTSGQTVYARALESNQGSFYIPGPILPWDIFVPQMLAVDWRAWPLAARQQGAFMHSPWWRRMSSRDIELQERQMLQKPFSVTVPAGAFNWTLIQDSRHELYQPDGIGAQGGWLVGHITVANTVTASYVKLDYDDEPDPNHDDALFDLGNGTYEIRRKALESRDGTQILASCFYNIGNNGTVYSLTEPHLCKFHWEVP